MDSYYGGRVAVVTGAGSGIGRALAVRLARAGATLALLDRDGPAADDTVRQCREAGAADVIHTGTVLASRCDDAACGGSPRRWRWRWPWAGTRCA